MIHGSLTPQNPLRPVMALFFLQIFIPFYAVLPYCVIIVLKVRRSIFMRLMISPSKNAKSFYVIKSVQKNGKNTSEIVEKLGTETFIKETYGVDDAEAWARSHVNELNAVLPVPCHTIFLSCCP
jgi:hypothetical protein